MTEQKLEKVIIDKFAAALTAANITGIQIIGAWQSTAADALPKAIEDSPALGYLTVKATPRAYTGYIAAEGEISVAINLNVRAESDAHGTDYLAIANALNAVLYTWQRNYSSGAADFNIANEFDFTGFRLDGGDVGLDRSSCIFTFIQNFTLQGVFRT